MVCNCFFAGFETVLPSSCSVFYERTQTATTACFTLLVETKQWLSSFKVSYCAVNIDFSARNRRLDFLKFENKVSMSLVVSTCLTDGLQNYCLCCY